MKKIILNTILIRWQTNKPLISNNERFDLGKAFNLLEKKFENVEYEPNSQIQQIVLRHNGFTYLFFSTGKIQILGKNFSSEHENFLDNLFKECLGKCIVKKEEKPNLTKRELTKIKENLKENQKIIKRLKCV